MRSKTQPTACQVLVCQNTACKRMGAARVLQAFRGLALAEVELISSGCLGQCGTGPVVLVLPEQVWYRYVGQRTVEQIVAQHNFDR